MTKKLKGAWATHVGNRKPSNEDSVFFGGECLFGKSMDDPEAVELETRCSQDLQTARSDVDCQSLLSIDP